MGKRDFIIKRIIINGISINRIIVDDPVAKHGDITDVVILELVNALDKSITIPEDVKWPYEYFVTLIEDGLKNYKVVWLLEEGKNYIGIITIHRVKRSLKWPFLVKKN
ncbi:MAG: hypothetical protein E2O68_08785 [Deltaproteobacteria bacterium]|nr:MAG: hypothetical protein E2O68_08785 [Deltaproteobacteria bacterium]